MSRYNFYMQRIDIANQPIKNLEVDFNGLIYSKCVGLESKGKPRNYASESFAESDKVNVYVPTQVVREPVDVTFTFYFKGTNRRTVFNNFYEYVRTGIFKYWDTARNKEVSIYLDNEVSPSEDILVGSNPYIQADFKFKSVEGGSKPHL